MRDNSLTPIAAGFRVPRGRPIWCVSCSKASMPPPFRRSLPIAGVAVSETRRRRWRSLLPASRRAFVAQSLATTAAQLPRAGPSPFCCRC